MSLNPVTVPYFFNLQLFKFVRCFNLYLYYYLFPCLIAVTTIKSTSISSFPLISKDTYFASLKLLTRKLISRRLMHNGIIVLSFSHLMKSATSVFYIVAIWRCIHYQFIDVYIFHSYWLLKRIFLFQFVLFLTLLSFMN